MKNEETDIVVDRGAVSSPGHNVVWQESVSEDRFVVSTPGHLIV